MLVRSCVPTISLFYGIAIRMFFNDHAPPHFHAVHGDDEGIVDIATGELIAGRLPATARRLVRDWALQYNADGELGASPARSARAVGSSWAGLR